MLPRQYVTMPGKVSSKTRQSYMATGDAVRVHMSTNPVPTISKTDQTNDWFESLQRCFGWNNRVDQQPQPARPSPSRVHSRALPEALQ